ncbi:MAG: Spore coat polysaccharide biosynthesis protein SpsA [Nitrosomonadaceae bacterium]|nr:Spore coat polysaccharide biosynthesis protein SpsA [Nitrosomonadaceae bacterium]
MTVEVKPGLVTVVVASYNHAEFLMQRMESLIAQTYPGLEILVIDDCSTDNSIEVLRRYQFHPKVNLVVREKNGGWVAVSNQGLELATGEFVIFANCDDDCDPCMIQRLVDAMNRNPTAGIAFCCSLLVDAHNIGLGDDFVVREPLFRVRCATDTLLSGAEMGRFLLHSCVIPNLSAALIRRTCFASVGNLSPAYRVCCDWDLFFRISARYDVAYIAESLNRFRQHRTTIRSVTKERVVYEEYFRLLLGQINLLGLTWVERCRLRMHVMYLWSIHLLTFSKSGWGNFPYHFERVLDLDPLALVFLVPSMMLRAVRMLGKPLVGRLVSRSAGSRSR